MVAVFILTIALTALINLTARSLFSARYARNEITANYLLQEVADYVRNERDSIAFHSGGWQEFLDKFGESSSGLCFSSKGCYFDVNNNIFFPSECSSENIVFGSVECKVLNYNEGALGGSFYNYNNGTPSNFKRHIVMNLNNLNPDELYITITVEWLNGNSVRSRSLHLSLLKWLDN